MRTRRDEAVVVVGGGLGGLIAATRIARGGRTVTLLERGAALGGRARTRGDGGFRLNLGPHAVFRAGALMRELRALGVPVRGGVPGARTFFDVDGALRPLPTSALALLVSPLLTWRGRAELATTSLRLRAEARANAFTTLHAWLDGRVRDAGARRLLEMLIRVSTYADDPTRQSAGAALDQLARGLDRGVLYVDGGWETLIEGEDGLRAAALASGVTIRTCADATAIEHAHGRVTAVRLSSGEAIAAAAVIVAASPATARALVDLPSLRAADEAALPVRAACLDVALARLPRPEILVVLGGDAPTYLSVHSATARLAPPGGAVVHVARYLGPGDRDEADAGSAADRDASELEALLDRAQPGWRDVVVTRSFLPRLVVSNALADAARGGTAGRPGPAVPEIAGLYVVGDWVGSDGMLADASAASAARAADLVLTARATIARTTPHADAPLPPLP